MATRRQVQTFAATLSDEFLACRQYMHPWKPSTVERSGRRFDIHEVCPRCDSKRHVVLDAKGMYVGHPSITYSKGYLASGMGRITGEAKGVLRLENVSRIIEGHGLGDIDLGD